MDDKSLLGQNYGVFGTMSTGKTHLTLEWAMHLHIEYGKKIIILDHANNDSYAGINNVIGVTDLVNIDKKPQSKIYKVQYTETDEEEGVDNIDAFCTIGTKLIHDSVIVLDDCGNNFAGNLSDPQKAFVKSAKNNRNHIFYQCHDMADIAPFLCRSFQVILLKEQGVQKIPDKMPFRMELQRLHDEIIQENNLRGNDKRWSYRGLDTTNRSVWFEDEDKKLRYSSAFDYFGTL